MTLARFTLTADAAIEQVLPGVWRWSAADSDRCGTALATPDGLLLVDPPALHETARRALESAAGPVRHVALTSARHVGLAAPFRDEPATVWASAGTGTHEGGAGRRFAPGDALPGGLIACELPGDTAPDGEVALLWPSVGDGLLITGNTLPVIGQTPVYFEGAAASVPAYLDGVRALLAADPGTLAPGRQGPFSPQVARATAYAAHLGTPYHARRGAPVEGPRFLVPDAQRVLEEVLSAPVIMRRTPEGDWLPDPFACARCGRPNEPMRQTCGGPTIARLCPACRAVRRREPPEARVMVCAGGCCTREGARAVLSAARQALAADGLSDGVDVVPVSCLGECSLGPFVRVSRADGREPAFAARYREQSVDRARRYADDEGEVIDDESELVLSRFAALVQPGEVPGLLDGLVPAAPSERYGPRIGEASTVGSPGSLGLPEDAA